MLKKILLIAGVFLSLTLNATKPVYAATSTPTRVVNKIVTLPQVPSLTAKTTADKVTLRWGASPKKLFFTNHTVFRSEKIKKLGAVIGHASSTIRTFVDSVVLPDHTYYYSVRYERPGARLTNGQQIKARTKKATLTSAPTIPLSPVAVPHPSSTPPVVTASTTVSSPTVSNTLVTSPTAPSTPNIFSNINPTAPTITDTHASANDAARLTTLSQLQTALQQYYNDQSAYPTGSGITLGLNQTSCLNSDGWGGTDCPYPYFGQIPPDPGASAYVYTSTGDSYTVTDSLDGTINNLSGKIVLTPSGISKGQ